MLSEASALVLDRTASQRKLSELQEHLRDFAACGICGVRCPSSGARKIVGGLFKETWYSGKHCGYCGKQGDVSWPRAQKIRLSRIFGELRIANDLLHGVGHSKRKVPLLMAITAAQTCLRNEGQVARKLCVNGALCSEIQKGAAVAGQLRRSKRLVALMGVDYSDVFIAGYDCALLLLALD